MIELLSTLGAVLEHCAHCGVAVDVCVLALNVVVLGSLEGEVLVNLHKLGVHISYSCALCAVEDELLGCSGVAVLDKYLFYRILNVLNGGLSLARVLESLENFLSELFGCFIICSADSLCSLIDSLRDFF